VTETQVRSERKKKGERIMEKRKALSALSVLGGAMLAASVAVAQMPAASPKVSCDEIQKALSSGKSENDVAKELKVSVARVKECAKQKK